MSERDLDALIESLAEAERAGYERTHGQDILNMVDHNNKRASGEVEDPLMQILRAGIEARLKEDEADKRS